MPDPESVKIVGVGFTWTTLFTGVSGASLLALLTVIIRQIGPWRKQRDEAEKDLRTALTQRVDRLEKTLERERTRHEAERALDRHKIANLNQCLDAVLIILETAPEKTVEVVGKVREMREAQLASERAEAAAIHAAELAARTKDENDAANAS